MKSLKKIRDEMAEKHSAIIGRLRFAFDEKPSLSTVGEYAGHDYRIGFDAAAAIFEQREKMLVDALRFYAKMEEIANTSSAIRIYGGAHTATDALAALEASRVDGDGGG